MPNKNRNSKHTRGKWSQDQLTAALEAIKKSTSSKYWKWRSQNDSWKKI